MEQYGYRAEDAHEPELVDVVVTATLRAAIAGARSDLGRRLRQEIKQIGAERDMPVAQITAALQCADDFIRQSLRDRNGH